MNLWEKIKKGERDADRIENAGVQKVTLEHKKALSDIRGEVALLYENYADKDGIIPPGEVQKYNRLDKTESNIKKIIAGLVLVQIAQTKKTTGLAYAQSYYRTAHAVETAVGANLGYKELEKAVAHNVWKRAGTTIQFDDRIREQAVSHLRRVSEAIERGIQQGRPYTKTAKEIKEIMGNKAWEAERIVRTESHRVKVVARHEALTEAEKEGVVMTRKWLSALDERTRDMHRSMDGRSAEIIDGEVTFVLPDGIKGYPGNTGFAHHDINCRCDETGEVEGFEPQTRRARYTDAEYAERKAAAGPGELVPRSYEISNMDYNQWAEMKGLRLPTVPTSQSLPTIPKVSVTPAVTKFKGLSPEETRAQISRAQEVLKEKRRLERELRKVNKQLGL